MKKQSMILNQETAMRLWNKYYGNETRVADFANRVIDKGAYNDRKSKYGWNVDHILPESRGGKTNDSNLICCHISTNDEKADKFPCFTANNIKFEIIKVQNHYEIKQVNQSSDAEPTKKTVKPKTKVINFMDSAAGIRLFKRLDGSCDDGIYVAGVIVRFNSDNKAPIIEFIKKLLGDDFYYEYHRYQTSPYFLTSDNDIEVVAIQYDVDTKEKTAKIIQKCVMLNTYFCHYFKRGGFVDDFDIYYREDNYDRYSPSLDEEISKKLKDGLQYRMENTLHLNKTVIESNEDVQDRIGDTYQERYYVYDYTYKELKKNLIKEVDG